MDVAEFHHMLHNLLGCEWGRKIALAENREPCEADAVQRIALHGPNGHLVVQLCDRHRALVLDLTDPSEPGKYADDHT